MKVIVAVLILSSLSYAAIDRSRAGAASSSEPTPVAKKKKKSTEVSFDEVLVEGKYHFADESVTTVEDDKVVDALLSVRTDFKDRILKSSSRH